MQGHQYEIVSGSVCEAFGYIPRTGETINVVLEKENREDHGDYNNAKESDRQDEKEKTQVFKHEILAGNARKVSAVRFERVNNEDEPVEGNGIARLVPKIVRRKWNSDSDDELDRMKNVGEVLYDEIANDYVASVQDNLDQVNKQ